MDEGRVTAREFEMLAALEDVVVPERSDVEAKASKQQVAALRLRAELAPKLARRLREVSKLALYLLMNELSHRFGGSYWPPGMEFHLWESVLQRRKFQREEPTAARDRDRDEVDELCDLTEEAGGWYAASVDDAGVPAFWTTKDWTREYALWQAEDPGAREPGT